MAIKTLKEGSVEGDKVRFLQEAAISGQFQHPNVVRLQGVVTVGEPVGLDSSIYLALACQQYNHTESLFILHESTYIYTPTFSGKFV